MRTISVLSSKGGAGKTTLVKSLLTAASHKGARAAFIECDQNGSLLSWAKNAALNGLWPEGIDAYQVLDIQKLSGVLCPSSYKVGHPSGLSIGGSGSFV